MFITKKEKQHIIKKIDDLDRLIQKTSSDILLPLNKIQCCIDQTTLLHTRIENFSIQINHLTQCYQEIANSIAEKQPIPITVRPHNETTKISENIIDKFNHKRYKKYSMEQIVMIQSLIDTGASVRDISKKLHIPVSYIYKLKEIPHGKKNNTQIINRTIPKRNASRS